jgi:radical SAM superfamily enzyme YgiQ (UPF0313 family)
MKILFVTSGAPDRSPFSTSEKRPPLGVGSLMATARKAGHQVFFIDNYLRPTRFIEEGFLQAHRIDCVGIYANTICYRDTLRMFNKIEELRKKSLWTGKIMVGGPHTSVALETIPGFVDHVVQGEGEHALTDILEGQETARVVKGRRVEDLDALPFQPWDLFTALPYTDICPWMEGPSIFTMNTSRGCPYGCSFCSVGSVWGSRYVAQSAERVLAEMEYLEHEFGAKGFYFREDHFTLDLKRTMQFCELLLSSGFRFPWACETRVDRITRDLAKLMAAAGCRAVYFGVESGSQRILDRLHKNITVGQIENAVQLCQQVGINVYCSLMTGVPGETYEDFLKTEELMRRLRPHSYAFQVFVGIPISPLYRECLENGSYEYRDDVGLLYPPGFDIKAEYFYGRKSSAFVDHHFEQRTAFDRRLMPRCRWRRMYRVARACVPKRIRTALSKMTRTILASPHLSVQE